MEMMKEEKKKFERTPVVDSGVISSTKFLTSMSANPAPVIAGICHRYRLTPEFIEEFKYYITQKMFMESPRLQVSLTERYPELFDYNAFVNAIRGTQKTDDEEEEHSDEEEEDVSVEAPESEEKKDENLEETLVIDKNKLSLSMVAKLKSDSDTQDYIDNEVIMDSIFDATQDELKDEESILTIMGINSDIDNLLLKTIKDQDIKDSILLALSVSDNSNLSSATYKYYSNDMKESILGTEDVNPKDFVSALAESKDLGWKERMINDAVSGKIQLRKTSESFEKDVLQLFTGLPRGSVAKFLTLITYMPNTLNYRVLTWVLENKDFAEDDYITALSAFKSAGLFFNLKKIAKQNDYKKLEEALSGN